MWWWRRSRSRIVDGKYTVIRSGSTGAGEISQVTLMDITINPGGMVVGDHKRLNENVQCEEKYFLFSVPEIFKKSFLLFLIFCK